MKLLFIGGTRFFGRRLLEAAVSVGHEVTVFHRGNSPLPEGITVTEILGDRNRDIESLDGEWDVTIDMCGYLPQSVEASARFLRSKSSKYVFISSISAYGDFSNELYDENTELAQLSAEAKREVLAFDPTDNIDAYSLGENYGGAKALCEEVVTDVFGDDALIVRPGLIVGKYDPTDRFTYWVTRIAAGGKVLVPGDKSTPVQFIEANDLANWVLKALEQDLKGAFHVTGIPNAVTFGSMVESIKEATNSDAELIWVSESFLKSNGVKAWSDLPVFLYSDSEICGLRLANVKRALETGLEITPLSETVIELFEWRRQIPDDLKAGISRECEAGLIDLWQEGGTDEN